MKMNPRAILFSFLLNRYPQRVAVSQTPIGEENAPVGVGKYSYGVWTVKLRTPVHQWSFTSTDEHNLEKDLANLRQVFQDFLKEVADFKLPPLPNSLWDLFIPEELKELFAEYSEIGTGDYSDAVIEYIDRMKRWKYLQLTKLLQEEGPEIYSDFIKVVKQETGRDWEAILSEIRNYNNYLENFKEKAVKELNEYLQKEAEYEEKHKEVEAVITQIAEELANKLLQIASTGTLSYKEFTLVAKRELLKAIIQLMYSDYRNYLRFRDLDKLAEMIAKKIGIKSVDIFGGIGDIVDDNEKELAKVEEELKRMGVEL